MNFTDWMPLIISLLSGTGLVGLWLKGRNEYKQSQALRAKEAKAVAAAAEQQMHANATALVEGMLDRHVVEFQRNGERLDALENRNNELAARNDSLVTDLAESHRQVRVAEKALVETERKLLIAEQERDRKERVILQLQEEVGILKNTIAELRAREEKLTTALADCAKTGTVPADCPAADE